MIIVFEVTSPAQLMEKLGVPRPVYRFLIQAYPSLGGITGEDALRQGRGVELLKVADAISEGSFA